VLIVIPDLLLAVLRQNLLTASCFVLLQAKAADEVVLTRIELSASAEESKGQKTVIRRLAKNVTDAGTERVVIGNDFVDCEKLTVSTETKTPEVGV
jgi:hypothetical protein